MRQTLKQEITAAAEACEHEAKFKRNNLEYHRRKVSELSVEVAHFEQRAAEYRALLAKLD